MTRDRPWGEGLATGHSIPLPLAREKGQGRWHRPSVAPSEASRDARTKGSDASSRHRRHRTAKGQTPKPAHGGQSPRMTCHRLSPSPRRSGGIGASGPSTRKPAQCHGTAELGTPRDLHIPPACGRWLRGAGAGPPPCFAPPRCPGLGPPCNVPLASPGRREVAGGRGGPWGPWGAVRVRQRWRCHPRRLRFAFQRRRQLCRNPGAAPPAPLNINACPTLRRGTCHGRTPPAPPPRPLAGLGSCPGPPGAAPEGVGGMRFNQLCPPPPPSRGWVGGTKRGGSTVGCGGQRVPRAPVVGEAGGQRGCAMGQCWGLRRGSGTPTLTWGSQQEQPGSGVGAGNTPRGGWLCRLARPHPLHRRRQLQLRTCRSSHVCQAAPGGGGGGGGVAAAPAPALSPSQKSRAEK